MKKLSNLCENLFVDMHKRISNKETRKEDNVDLISFTEFENKFENFYTTTERAKKPLSSFIDTTNFSDEKFFCTLGFYKGKLIRFFASNSRPDNNIKIIDGNNQIQIIDYTESNKILEERFNVKKNYSASVLTKKDKNEKILNSDIIYVIDALLPEMDIPYLKKK